MTLPFFVGSPVRFDDLPSSKHAFEQSSIPNITATSPIPGSPEVSVEFVAPPSGYVLGIIGAGVSGDNDRARCYLEIMDDTGNIVQTAGLRGNGLSSTLFSGGPPNMTHSRIAISPNLGIQGTLESPLVPGAIYKARFMHDSENGSGTSDIDHRELTICPLPLGAAVASEVTSQLDNVPSLAAGTQTTILNVSNELNTSPPDFQPSDPNAQLTFVAPHSGRILILIGGGLRDNTNNNRVAMGVMVKEDNADGREIIKLNTGSGSTSGNNNYQRFVLVSSGDTTAQYMFNCKACFLDGLDPGRAYYAETQLAAMITSGPGASADVFNQRLCVIGVA